MLANVAAWHAEKALKAYRARNYKTYRRHIRIADLLWKKA